MARSSWCFALAWMLVLSAVGLVPAPAGAGTPPEIRADARWQFSGDDGATWSPDPPTVPGGKVASILARTPLDVPAPAGAGPRAVGFWKLTHALPPRMKMTFSLNDRELSVPLGGMYYKTIPAIPASLVRKGKNLLRARIRIDNRPPRHDRRRVMPGVTFGAPAERAILTGQTLRFQTGPILGAFGPDYFTVTCRTNVPVPVRLIVKETAWRSNWQPASPKSVAVVSKAGLFHRFRVAKHMMAEKLEYRLEAALGGQKAAIPTCSASFPVFGLKGRPDNYLRFVIFGDSRSRTDDWATVAAAVLKERPDFVVFTGDMNDHGTNDWEWDEHYLAPAPARKLLATVPFYAVKGNHEENAPLFMELFYTPSADGKAENWAQQIGPVLLIGINGQWSPRWGRTHAWIEKTLAESRAKFIFFASHYPAWSSAGNGKLDPRTGLPRHWAYLTGRRVLVPMLVKYEATAFVVSHEHHYERSELPGGLPQIISGGAGAPRSGKSRDAERQNPYSKVFVNTPNYCLFEVTGDRCTLRAKTPDGEVIDTLTWRAREPK